MAPGGARRGPLPTPSRARCARAIPKKFVLAVVPSGLFDAFTEEILVSKIDSSLEPGGSDKAGKAGDKAGNRAPVSLWFIMVNHPLKGWQRAGPPYLDPETAKGWKSFVKAAWRVCPVRVVRYDVRFDGQEVSAKSVKKLSETFNLDVQTLAAVKSLAPAPAQNLAGDTPPAEAPESLPLSMGEGSRPHSAPFETTPDCQPASLSGVLDKVFEGAVPRAQEPPTEGESGPLKDCSCRRCLKENDVRYSGIPAALCTMVLCAVCGNKRCPHANDHRNPCTNSNEPGQPGSAYAHVPPVAGALEQRLERGGVDGARSEEGGQ